MYFLTAGFAFDRKGNEICDSVNSTLFDTCHGLVVKVAILVMKTCFCERLQKHVLITSTATFITKPWHASSSVLLME